jgi:hypothetical protein
MLSNAFLLLLAGALSAAPVSVEDTYTIKIKKGAKGDVTTEDKRETEQTKFKIEDPDGKAVSENETKTVTTTAYKETILEKEKGKRATKLRREYTKAAVKAGDKETTLPYQGKTVLIEKKDAKYHFTVENDKELTGKDAAVLEKEFNKKSMDDSDDDKILKILFPKKSVKVGMSWKIDPAILIKEFEKEAKGAAPLDKDKVTATGKLVRAYKKDGKQFGVLAFEIEMPLKGEFPLGETKAPIQAGSKISLRINADTCIDGTSSDVVGEMSMHMTLNATFKGPDGKEYKLSLTSQQTEKSTEKDLSKK